ncbi:unnamed protein product [Rotaria socialis]
MLIDEQNLDQIISTIRAVHQMTIDHRLIDLTEFLTEFFQSIQPQQSNLFPFQTAQLCHLTIYIDGLIRKEIKDFKYISFPNDSINLASIGSPSQRPKSSVLKMKTKSLSTTIAKSIQPLKRLLSSKTKNSVFNYPLNLSYFSQF